MCAQAARAGPVAAPDLGCTVRVPPVAAFSEPRSRSVTSALSVTRFTKAKIPVTPLNLAGVVASGYVVSWTRSSRASLPRTVKRSGVVTRMKCAARKLVLYHIRGTIVVS